MILNLNYLISCQLSSSSSLDIADIVNKKTKYYNLLRFQKDNCIIQDTGFPIESVLENDPSHIPEILE
jgi:hypothetical protein